MRDLKGKVRYDVEMNAEGVKTGAKSAADGMDDMDQSAGGAGGSLGNLKTAILAAGAAFVTSKLVGQLKDGAESAAKFAERATKLKSTLRHLGEETGAIGALALQLRGLAVLYGQAAPEDVVDAYEQMITTAWSVAEAQREIHTVLKANAAGYGETTDLIEFAARAQEYFNLEASDTERILERGTVAATRGHIAFEDFIKLFEKNSAVLKRSNADFEETIGVVSYLSGNISGGRKLLASFGTALDALAAPTGTARDEMDRLGISWSGWVGTLKELREAGDEVDWDMLAPDSSTQALMLEAVDNLDDMEAHIRGVSAASGILKADFADTAKDVAYQGRIVSAAMGEIKRSAGDAVLQGFVPLGAAFSETYDEGQFLTEMFLGMSATLYNMIYGVTGLAGAIVGNLAVGFDTVRLSAGAAWATITGDAELAGKLIAEAFDIKKQIAPAQEYLAGFRGMGWVNEYLGKQERDAGAAEAMIAERQARYQELIDAMDEAPPAGGPPGAAPPKLPGARVEKPEAYRTMRPTFGRPEKGVDVHEVELKGKLNIDEVTAEFEAAWARWESAGAGMITNVIMAGVEGADVGDLFEERAREGLRAGIQTGIEQGMKATGAGVFLQSVVSMISAIPVIGPILGAFISSFISFQEGGFATTGPVIQTRVFGERAAAGVPEGYIPWTAENIAVMSKGLAKADIGPVGKAAEINLFVHALDPLGVEFSRRNVRGTAARKVREF